MKRDYYYINNFENAGDLAIGRHAIEHIATIAADSVPGAKVQGRKKSLFALESPVRASFRKDGRIDLRLDVSISKDVKDVGSVCSSIQEAVDSAVRRMAEALPFSIEVRVSSLS